MRIYRGSDMPVYTRMILVASTTLIVGAVQAQDFPSRPIRIITSTAVSGSDCSARQIAQGLIANIGQSVIVENRPSALAADMAAKAQGDGYTLLLDSNSLWLTPLIQKMPYDVLRDFTPVTLAST